MIELQFINLGWGVQSFTMAAMVALGHLPPVTSAIHADTTHEMSATYRFASKWTPWLESRNVQVVTVRDEKAAASFFDLTTGVTHMPLHTLTRTGQKGQLNRSCTERWKIRPIRRYITDLLKSHGANKTNGCVEQWLGISTDEADRQKPSDVKFVRHRFPLLELGMSRTDCVAWLQSQGLEVPPKSACKQCPYHSQAVWKMMKETAPEDYAYAVGIDRAIRHKRPGYECFVNSNRRPLGQTYFEAMSERGQWSLFDGDSNECTGNCFL